MNKLKNLLFGGLALAFFLLTFQNSPCQNVLWGYDIETVLSHGVDIVQDDHQRLVVLGNIPSGPTEVAPYGPEPGSLVNLNSGSGYFLVNHKSGCSADFYWVTTAHCTGDVEAREMVRNAAGDLFVAGTFTGDLDFSTAPNSIGDIQSAPNGGLFVARYTSNGDFGGAFVLPETANTGSRILTGLGVDAHDNVAICGYYNGSIDFDPSPNDEDIETSAQFDLFVARYIYNPVNNSYSHGYALGIGGSNAQEAHSLAMADDGRVFITGRVSGGAIDFNPEGAAQTAFSPTIIGQTDIFLAGYSTAGTELFAKRLGGSWNDLGAALSLHPNGDYLYLAAELGGNSGNFDGVAVNYTSQTGSANDQRGWILASFLPSDGNIVDWEAVGANHRTANSGTAWPGGIRDLFVDDTGVNLFLVGNYNNEFTLFPGNAHNDVTQNGLASVLIRASLNNAMIPNWHVFTDGPLRQIELRAGTAPDGLLFTTGFKRWGGSSLDLSVPPALCQGPLDICDELLCGLVPGNLDNMVVAGYIPFSTHCQSTGSTPSNLSATTLSSNPFSVQFDWASGSIPAWELEYWQLNGPTISLGLSGTPPFSLNLPSTGSPLFFWRVKGICSPTDTTFWSGTSSFIRPRSKTLSGEARDLMENPAQPSLVFPNPTSGQLSIQFPSSEVRSISISDLQGRRLIDRQALGASMELDLSALPSGVYLLECIQGQARHVEKIMVK